MADEKQYVIPLRKELNKVACYKKTKRAIGEIRKYIIKHMKVEDVKIGKNLNYKIWEHGIKNPPHKVKVKAIKEDNYARVELPEFEFEKKQEKAKKGVKEKIQEKLGVKTTPTKEKEIKAEEKLLKEGKIEAKESKPKSEEFKKEEDRGVEEKIRSDHIIHESKRSKLEKTRS